MQIVPLIDAFVNMEKEPFLSIEGAENGTANTDGPEYTKTRRSFRIRDCVQGVLSLLMLAVLVWDIQRRIHIMMFDRKWTEGIIPKYVLDYAPLVFLDEEERYQPSDMLAQLQNTHPRSNFTIISDAPSPLTLNNLDLLNHFGTSGGRNVFLTSDLDVTASPIWLNGAVPDIDGATPNATSAAIIAVNKGAGIVDAFYMYFYAYNQGNTVFAQELGDHVGDWEHNMIRFDRGRPQHVWYSQHGNGQAFTYACVEKLEDVRPISYSARGSHANYAIPGIHEHTIPNHNFPFGFLEDHTSPGRLWDPIKNAFWYTFRAADATFVAARNMRNGSSPVPAMQFRGRWGDQAYPDEDPRQKRFFGFRKFVGGPTGPYNKGLGRREVCLENGLECIIRDRLGP